MLYMCPVCGYEELPESAYKGKSGLGSLEICYSCGFQFGYTDHAVGISHEEWRARWIAGGMKWDSIGRPQPKDWDPVKQLRNVVKD